MTVQGRTSWQEAKVTMLMSRVLVLTLLIVAAKGTLVMADDLPAWTFKSGNANEALRKYRAARKKLDEGYEQQRKESRAALVKQLEETMKQSTQAGELDDALAIRDAIKMLQQPAEAPAESGNRDAAATTNGNPTRRERKMRADQPEQAEILNKKGADAEAPAEPGVVAIAIHSTSPASNPRSVFDEQVRFYATGTFKGTRGGTGSWSVAGKVLLMKWPNGGLDRCLIASDGKSYRGQNEARTQIGGHVTSGSLLPPKKKS